jgi:hypothetical protein
MVLRMAESRRVNYQILALIIHGFGLSNGKWPLLPGRQNLNGSIVWKPAWAMSTWLWTSSWFALGGSPVAQSSPLGSTDLRRHLLVLPEAMALM